MTAECKSYSSKAKKLRLYTFTASVARLKYPKDLSAQRCKVTDTVREEELQRAGPHKKFQQGKDQHRRLHEWSSCLLFCNNRRKPVIYQLRPPRIFSAVLVFLRVSCTYIQVNVSFLSLKTFLTLKSLHALPGDEMLDIKTVLYWPKLNAWYASLELYA